MWNLEESGINEDKLWQFINEHIYSLPGCQSHEDVFTILLTGSRAIGMHAPDSDIDINVLCPGSTYDAVYSASKDMGIIKADHSFFRVLRDDDWHRYFGKEVGPPHFSLTPIQEVQQQFQEYDDIDMWIWTHAKVITDPESQFQRIIDNFSGYPNDVLVRKIKYRWLLAGYWAVDSPRRQSDDTLLAHAVAPLNAANELLKLCFLVEGKPFPYSKKLMPLARLTKLGKELCPILQYITDLVVGKIENELTLWDRIDRAFSPLLDSNESPECQQLEAMCAKAMIAAGVAPEWVEADYDNIDELLSGQLGLMP